MTESAFREIQLSAKQLVFLFMSVVVAAVVIFLLGVSVGRGIGEESGMQAETALSPGDTLVTTDRPTSEPEAEVPEEPPASGASAEAVPPATAVANPPPPAAPPPPSPDPPAPAARATPPPVTPNPPVAGGDWVLQVGAFGSRENADGLVAKLKQRGYPAYIERTSSGTVPFAVRVGPFATRAETETVSQRLAKEPEGYNPLIIR